MKIRILSLVLCILVSSTLAQDKPEAKIGDPAGKLEGLQWIKGGPVELKKDKVFVVEFWATWCPPCRTSIPHLTEVQKKFKESGVTVIGISNETADKVKPFVEEKGDEMAYVVAIDPEKKTTPKYMQAYKQGGIPTAFIVDKQGNIAWVGHPMADLDAVLAQVVEGTFDVQEYAKKKALEREKYEKSVKAFKEYFEAIGQDDGAEKAVKLARQLIVNGSDQMLNTFAWRILTEVEGDKQDLATALKAAAKANKLTEGKNAAVLDTFGLALFKNGKIARAIKVQTQAVKLVKNNEQMHKEMAERLAEFKKARTKQTAKKKTEKKDEIKEKAPEK
ncbi:MAG: TlpA family protein disulfide reductase [Sedimentisphaerales bacterium]|nr:TlpA family protein disulfide reductase [Sedimentisphaerales bacterium]